MIIESQRAEARPQQITLLIIESQRAEARPLQLYEFKNSRFYINDAEAGFAGRDFGVVAWRGDQVRDDQLPDSAAGERWFVLRKNIRSGKGLGMLLRKIQKNPLQRHRLRQVRSGGDPFYRAPGKNGAHPAGLAGGAYLVFARRAVKDRYLA